VGGTRQSLTTLSEPPSTSWARQQQKGPGQQQQRGGGNGDNVEELRRLFLHYDFPSFSTGEVASGGGGGPNRRAVGHGALAQKSLDAVMPPSWKFPYVARLACEVGVGWVLSNVYFLIFLVVLFDFPPNPSTVVSTLLRWSQPLLLLPFLFFFNQVLASNGSSSMASACAGTLALLDAGVPLLAPVAGVSVGLVSRPKEASPLSSSSGSGCGGSGSNDLDYVLLTDILGLEDHYGDMDFKVKDDDRGSLC
jgi:polyribonucleotide nucleotidyltransferase